MNKRIHFGIELIVTALLIDITASCPTSGQIKETRDVNSLIAALRSQDYGDREAAATALVKIGTPSVEPLILVLKFYKTSFARQSAAKALGEIKDVCAVEPLISVLKDNDIDIRQAATKALGQIKDLRSIEPLIAALKDKDWHVRESAADALGKIKDARAVEPLIEVLKEKGWDWHVRMAAAEALGQIKDIRAVEPLIEALNDKDVGVRGAAAESLSDINDARAAETVIALWDDNNLRVQTAAVKIQTDQTVLAKIALTGKYSDSREVSVRKINDENVIAKVASEDKFAKVRQAAVNKLADQMLLTRIAVEDKDYSVRQAAELRVDPVILWKVREDILLARSGLANVSDQNQLVQIAVTNSWRYVREAAVEKISDQNSLALVINTSKDWDVVKVAFNKITDTSVLTKLSEGTMDVAVKLAIRVRLSQENWTNAARKAAQGQLTTNDFIGAIALLPEDNALAGSVDYLCLAYIGKGDISRVPELIELLNLYGNKGLAEEYINCGQDDLNSAGFEWANKHGYQVMSGMGYPSTPIPWGSQKN